MKPERRRLYFSALFLLLACVFVVASLSYDFNARLVPLAVGFLTLALSVLVLINEVNPIPFVKKLSIDFTENYRSREPVAQKETAVSPQRFFVLVIWTTGFVLGIFMLGFHISIALFTFAFLKTEARASWPKAFLVTGIVWAAVFMIFEWAMGFSLFKGWVFGEILPPV
jgi:hypothetical protein